MTQTRRVLIITTAFPPSTCAGIHRIARFVRYLPEHGWTPSILSEGTEDGVSEQIAREFALPPDLVVQRTRALGRQYDVEGSDHRPPSNGSAAPSISKRLLQPARSVARNVKDLLLATPDRDIAWSVTTWRTAVAMVRRHRPDVILTSGPPHSTHLIGQAVKRITGVPWVADFRDPWSRRPWGMKANNPWGQRLLGRFERSCVRHADRIVLNTEPMADEFRKWYRGDDPRRFVSIPNGCDPQLSEKIQQLCDDVPPAPQSSSAVLRLCHPGSLYRKRDPRPLLEAVARLKNEGLAVEFEQIGSYDPGFALESFVRDHQLEQAVSLSPPVPHEECLQRMAQSDAFVLLQPGTATQVPGKLFEMMCFSKPIIALADEGATADLIRRFEIGAVTSATDVGQIAEVLRNTIRHKASGADGERWARARRECDSRTCIAALAHELDSLVDAPGTAKTPSRTSERVAASTL